jgi:hypothetical protein
MFRFLLTAAFGAVVTLPAQAQCYTVPVYQYGQVLDRVICNPQPAYNSGIRQPGVDASIPLQAGQNLPRFGPAQPYGGQTGSHCISRQIGSTVYTDCQ